MSVTMADSRASKKILAAKKPIDRVQSLAETIIFCMSEDAASAPPPSNGGTPGTMTPVPQAFTRLQNGLAIKTLGSSDSLAAAGQKSETDRRYLAGSKALDHLSRLLTSCETVRTPQVDVISADAFSPVLPSQQFRSLVRLPHYLLVASFQQLRRAVESRRGA